MKDISYNFGAIRDTVVKLSTAEILREDKSPTLLRFTEALSKIPVLKKQHLIFKNIQNSKVFEKERLAERFLAQNLQMFKNERWDIILRENKKLRKELLDDIHVQSKTDDKLFESINTLIESVTNPNFVDFEKEQESYEYVVSHLTRPVVNESEKSPEKEDGPNILNNSWKFVTQLAINNFNERYGHLNEEEQKVFKILVSDENTKRNYLESLKKESIELLDKKISEEISQDNVEVLKEFKRKIENMKNVNFVSLDECILSCIELKEELK
jgi:hypothetical protein